MASSNRHINFAMLRDRVLARSARSGKEYWRTLEEMTDGPEFQEFVAREFPQHAEEWHDPVERRTFLKIMGASLALAGLTGCAIQPTELAIPAVKPDPNQQPGKALFFATAMPLSGVATPLLVRSNDGRPTKAEGNDQHPASNGATDIFAQASILDLYDPDRSQNVTYRNDIRRWSDFTNELKIKLEDQRPKQGAGLRILTETVTSPTIADQLKSILTEFPQAKVYQYEPVGRGNVRAGAMMAFGQPVNVVYDLSKADRIFSIDCDFMLSRPQNLPYMRQYAEKKRPGEGKTDIVRLYVAETTPSATGLKADHRLPVKPSQIESLVRAVAQAVGVAGVTGTAEGEAAARFANALAQDLKANAGKCVVMAGDEQPAVIHALAHALNETLGNVGQTVRYTETLEASSTDALADIQALNGELNGGKVEMLIVMGGNPAYNTPSELGFGAAMTKAAWRAHFGTYQDETAALCAWHVPASHYLEMWGDARAYDGTVSVIQPLIAPLYDGTKSPAEFLSAFAKEPKPNGYDIVRAYWQPKVSGDFEKAWRTVLHNGMMPNTAAAEKSGLKVNTGALATATPKPTAGADTLEVALRSDPNIYDGRFANNGWLQELPRPLTKITWENVALVSPATAQRLKSRVDYGSKGGNTDVPLMLLDIKGKSVKVPLWEMPGQPDDVVTIYLGYGRGRAGRVGGNSGNLIGYNAYAVRTSENMWFATGATLTPTGESHEIASTQTHFAMENRNTIHETTLASFLQDPKNIHKDKDGHEIEVPGYEDSMYPAYDYKNQRNQPHADPEKHSYDYAWGMAIDVASCVGCNACIIACQSENNIPVVGKKEVARSREMHWLRVDTYFKAEKPEENEQFNSDSPMGDVGSVTGGHFIPMPCMHCENAPCEPVCPVHATVHSAEGLNDMVYNRCVGTRYCSNNCPYKVRRFNFFLYQDWNTPTYQIMRNPEVSVRSRGVMEKCTYCVQRIQNAKITAEVEGRTVRDGEILTACQSVCPTNAITFGNQNDPNSAVAKLKKEERNYPLLPDLNTQPRTTYLGTVSNPNDALKKA